MEIVGSSSEHMNNSHDHGSLDINNLATSLRKKLEILAPFSDVCCIYRVSPRIRDSGEKAYTPRVVSIGPFHHGKEELKAMEEHKMRCLQDFLSETRVSLEVFIKVIDEHEKILRDCYAETINLSSEEFVELMLLDAVFIIMFLRIHHRRLSSGRSTDILHSLRYDIGDDLILLENQLPFFIFDALLEQSSIFNNNFMIQLAIDFLKSTSLTWVRRHHALEKFNSSDKVLHFVDILRLCQQPSKPNSTEIVRTLAVPSVTQLYRAGVKFELSSSKNLLDMNFEKGILKIPSLCIYDGTEIIFRNVLAFEQCYSGSNYMVGDYIYFIKSLVNAPKDVEILIQNGIIKHGMPNNEAVSNLFCDLGYGVSLSPSFYFSSLVEDLNAFYESPWNRWKANLKQEYFNTPWAAISVAAAAILLILTALQSVCSVMQVS